MTATVTIPAHKLRTLLALRGVLVATEERR